MEQALPQLSRTRPAVGAAQIDVAFLVRTQHSAAVRAVGRHDELLLAAVSQGDDRTDDLGDDVTGLAEHDGVTDQHTLARDLLSVVQSRH